MITKRQQEFLVFCLVGGINTGIDFAVFAALFNWGVPLLPAHVLSYGCGTINSFLLNRKWTFKNKICKPTFSGLKRTSQSVRQMAQFVILNLLTLSLTYGVLVWIHDNWGWPMLLSRLLAIMLSLAFNFVGSRLWVFRQPSLKSKMV